MLYGMLQHLLMLVVFALISPLVIFSNDRVSLSAQLETPAHLVGSRTALWPLLTFKVASVNLRPSYFSQTS